MSGSQFSNVVTIDNSTKFFQTNFAGQIQGPVMASNVVNLTQNFYYSPSNAPDNQIQLWVSNIDSKVNAATNDIQLTRKDVLTLLSALKDLNERTKDIERLPDGRTKIGAVIVASIPSQADLTNALQMFAVGNYSEALRLATKAVETVELSETKGGFELRSLTEEGKGEIYALAAQSAQRAGSNFLANEGRSW